MAAKNGLFTNDLFAMSDALGMELFLHKNGDITGKAARSLSIKEIGLRMNMEPKVIWSKVDWLKDRGQIEPVIMVAVHVIGDLFLLAVTNKKNSEVVVQVVDGGQVKRYSQETVLDAVRNTLITMEKKAISTIVKSFAEVTVAGFTRDQYETAWEKLAA
jgi:hypothetical protein